jgi:hypothetical protein
MAIINFPRSEKAHEIGALRKIVAESIRNPVPRYVLLVMVLAVCMVSTVMILSIDFWEDPVSKKIVAVMFVAGSITFFCLAGLLWAEKKWRILTKNMKG